jgi:RNA polymerase sigma factor (sigma-70 family)
MPDTWGSFRDPDTFTRFHQTYVRTLTRSLRRRYYGLGIRWRIGTEDYHLAVDEGLSDAFLWLRMRFADAVPETVRLLALLMRVAQRRVLRRLRAEGRFTAVQEPLTEATPQGTVDTIWLRPAVRNVLHALPERQARALVGHYVEGHPLKDIAVKLQTTEEGAKSLLKRGRAEFRQHWQEGGSPR